MSNWTNFFTMWLTFVHIYDMLWWVVSAYNLWLNKKYDYYYLVKLSSFFFFKESVDSKLIDRGSQVD